MIKFTDRTADTKLNARQQRALAELLRRAAADEYAGTNPDTVIEYAVDVYTYGDSARRDVWVTVRPDIPSLPPGNALRVTTAIETWHVHIGKRGKLEAWTYPRSLDQFAGREWCGIHVMITELEKQRRAAKRAAKKVEV